MTNPAMVKRPGRQRNQLQHCYYEGFLEKRSFKDKKSRRLWACLCGDQVLFFNDKRESEYIEKLQLSELVSITDDNSVDRKLDAARLNLQMKNELINITLPSAEARELWKGFLYSVADLSVPSSINLLPGQIHTLIETVEKEKERIKNLTPPVKSSNLNVLPACFQKVSRMEAELLLEKEAQRGNLLLRPGRDGNTYAITTRQDFNGPVFKHYRVTASEDSSFTIDVDNPVQCSTLQRVVDSLVEKTEGVLIPLLLEQQYARKISFIRSDNENGEKIEQNARIPLLPPVPPPKPVTVTRKATRADSTDSLYLNEAEKLQLVEDQQQDSFVPPPRLRSASCDEGRKSPPPLPAPRKHVPTVSTSLCLPSRDARMRGIANPLSLTISELKQKLEKQGKCLE